MDWLERENQRRHKELQQRLRDVQLHLDELPKHVIGPWRVWLAPMWKRGILAAMAAGFPFMALGMMGPWALVLCIGLPFLIPFLLVWREHVPDRALLVEFEQRLLNVLKLNPKLTPLFRGTLFMLDQNRVDQRWLRELSLRLIYLEHTQDLEPLDMVDVPKTLRELVYGTNVLIAPAKRMMCRQKDEIEILADNASDIRHKWHL